jgi:glycosyltransferase involved in cell wall biosynthesis
MDSLAMARPLVVSNVGDMPFWVKENSNGWVAESVSSETINQTLEQAWDKRTNWAEMGKQSFAIFKQNFPINPVNHFLKQAGIIS